MKLSGITAAIILSCFSTLSAVDELGRLEDAQKRYPSLFVPGSVHEFSVRGGTCYIFSGQSEQFFTGELAETDSELYQEAALAAKNNLYQYFRKQGKRLVVELSSCGVMYRFNDRKLYTVVLYVPKDKVAVTVAEATALPPSVPSSGAASVLSSAPGKAQSKQPSGEQGVKGDAAVGAAAGSAVPGEGAGAPPRGEAEKEADMGDAATSDAKPVHVLDQPSMFERRVSKFMSRLEENPADVLAMISLADMYKKQGRFQEALGYYFKAVPYLVKDPYFDHEERLRILMECGGMGEQLQEDYLALKCYRLVLRFECTSEQRHKANAAVSRLVLRNHVDLK